MKDKEVYLYHYTSIEAFNGIVNSRSIWASDCRYLNDKLELIHARESFLAYFEGEEKEALVLFFHSYEMRRASCISSFSKSPEVLSQWRGYADDGQGVSIAFSKNNLVRMGSVVECIYDGHEEFICSLTTKYKDQIKIIIDMYKNKEADDTFMTQVYKEEIDFMESIYCDLLSIKNHVFSEEKEYRLIKSVPVEEIKTRTSNGLIVPYSKCEIIKGNEYEYLWCVLPEIWLGPKCDERNKEAIRAFGQFGWAMNNIKSFDCGYT